MNTKKVNVQMLEPQPTNGIRTIDTTSSQTIAKPNVSCSVNHKFVEKKHYYYHGADCYIYETICGFCKKKVGGWSEKQANDEWEKHCC